MTGIDRELVERVQTRMQERDDERILSDAMEELGCCQKETLYVVGGSTHPHAEERIQRIRQTLAEIDAMLEVVENRARSTATKQE